jgi:hypothetical protein
MPTSKAPANSRPHFRTGHIIKPLAVACDENFGGIRRPRAPLLPASSGVCGGGLAPGADRGRTGGGSGRGSQEEQTRR